MVIHGILDSSDSFANTDNSVIKHLLKEGYEVWAANNRGNKYSCTHKTFKNTSKEYWNFSFQEMAEFDVPAFYKKVLSVSGTNQITLIGHSQGATQSFAALSSLPEIDAKTERFVALAPVLFMNRAPEHPNILTFIVKYKILEIFDLLGINSILLVDVAQNSFAHIIIDLFCSKTSFVCSFLFHETIDKAPEYLDLKNMSYYLSYCPSGTSIKAFKHFSQLMYTVTPKFQKYDYGQKENMIKYGSKDPTLYDISNIKTKTSVFYGENDTLCSLENVSYLLDMKKDAQSYYMDQWGHMEYSWGKDKKIFLEKFSDALSY